MPYVNGMYVTQEELALQQNVAMLVGLGVRWSRIDAIGALAEWFAAERSWFRARFLHDYALLVLCV